MKSLFRLSSRGSSSQEDDSLNGSDPLAPPCISQLFTDAALYENLLVREGCWGKGCRRADSSGVDGFANLVGRDLDPSEQATIVADRLTKLTVTGDHWTSEELTAEPDSYASDETLIDTDSQTSKSSQSSTDSKNWTPAPKELIHLFAEEFGALAAEGEEEELIFEADVGLFLDVVLLVRNLIASLATFVD
jgi:sterol 3beta-glucosyltransferase